MRGCEIPIRYVRKDDPSTWIHEKCQLYLVETDEGTWQAIAAEGKYRITVRKAGGGYSEIKPDNVTIEPMDNKPREISLGTTKDEIAEAFTEYLAIVYR